ncbi:MAG: LPXTG cell wall anchor domain-containing protein [Clostridium sp.]|nr:LPXTG cell wall anchor domain-containing protein [Clostridium sp.]
MKKIYGILGSGFLAFNLLTTTVYADSTLNFSEINLISYLDNFSYKYNGKEFTVSEDLLVKLKSYLAKDGIELNDEQVNKVSTLSEDALINLVKKNALNIKDLTKEEGKSFIDNHIVKIADELNFKVTYNENLDITIKDANENIIYSDLPIEDNTPNEGGSDDKVEDDKVENDKVEDDKVEDDKVEDDKVEDDKVEDDKVEDDKVEDDKIEDTTEKDDKETDKNLGQTIIENNKNESLPQTGDSISGTVITILATLMSAAGIVLIKKR